MSNENKGIKVPADNISKLNEKVEAELSEDISVCKIAGAEYDLTKVVDGVLQATANALYAMCGHENEVEAQSVAAPLSSMKFINSIEPSHRAAVAKALEARKMAVCPTIGDRVVNFLSRNKVKIAVVVGTTAAAAGGYAAYRHTRDSDNGEEAEDGGEDNVEASEAFLTVA